MFAHFALSDPLGKRFLFDDRVARGARVAVAGADEASPKPPQVWLGSWSLRFEGKEGERQRIRANGRHRAEGGETEQEFSLDLEQEAAKPPIAHGRDGVSQKSAGAGRSSHYYSFTRLKSRGAISIGGESFEVEGLSWFDHEFGSNQLSKDQIGWDWFSLQLGDGRELMLYQLRLRGGGSDPFSSGTLVDRDGSARHLKREEFSIEPLAFWTSPSTGGRYPTRWKLRLPSEGLELEVRPALEAQELNTRRSTSIAYWEGLVSAQGTQNRRALSGEGYVELTGYAKPFEQTF
jgi:predicted secreted hydrolase